MILKVTQDSGTVILIPAKTITIKGTTLKYDHPAAHGYIYLTNVQQVEVECAPDS